MYHMTVGYYPYPAPFTIPTRGMHDAAVHMAWVCDGDGGRVDVCVCACVYDIISYTVLPGNTSHTQIKYKSVVAVHVCNRDIALIAQTHG
jgi:hypothetical protein